MWFRKNKLEPSTFWEDWNREQIARIRRGEPIMWPPGTPPEIVRRSQEIDRLNDQLSVAMRRKQDEDWAGWSPKQRKRARRNGEYYGEDRPLGGE